MWFCRYRSDSMDGENGGNAVPGIESAGAAPGLEPQILPVSEAAEEKQSYGGGGGGQGGMAVSGGGGEGEFSGKRKRGRPRKQPLAEARQELVLMAESTMTATPQKRGRGRPKGSGKWQTLAASFGGISGDSAGSKFTPHTVAIQTGENIAERFYGFAQRASESLCILSASGTVSSAEIRQAGSGGGTVRHEGHFEIISLSGSNVDNVAEGLDGKSCLLSVQLANTDGRLFGGAVAGTLIAGGPTQLVIATFRQTPREQTKTRNSIEPPKPNLNIFATPLQQANGEVQEAEVNGPASVSPVSAPPPVEPADTVVNGLDVNYASPQPFDWTSLQSSAPIPHVISDVNDRGANDQ